MVTPNTGVRHPSAAYHTDFFFLRFPIYYKGKLLEVRRHDSFAALYDSSLTTSIPLSNVNDVISSILTNLEKLDIHVLQLYYDKNCPIIAICFPPSKVLENVQSLLSFNQPLSHHITLAIASLFNHKNSTLSVKVNVELYLCSPINKDGRVHRLTPSNARFFVDMYENSSLFEFPTMMEQGDNCQNDTGESVKLCDLVKELKKAMDHWYGIGIQLRVPLHILLTIRKQPMSELERLTEMLTWLVQNSQPSWVKIVGALCTVDKKTLARHICAKYYIPFPAESIVDHEHEKHKLGTLADYEAQQVRSDIKTMTEKEYPHLKEKIESLTKEKEHLEATLKFERTMLLMLTENQSHSIKKEKQRNGCHDEDTIRVKEQTVLMLEDKLQCTEQECKSTTLRMQTLMKELSDKTCELEKKSHSRRQMEESLCETDGLSQTESRVTEEKKKRELARSLSQKDYVTEIQVQIEREETMIKEHQEEIQKIECLLREILEFMVTLQRNRSSMLEQYPSINDDNPNLDSIEHQFTLTKLNIELTDKCSELTSEKLRMKSLHEEILQRKLSLKLKQNLLPCLAKSHLEGVVIPVHKTAVNYPVEFKVTLCDKDGEICTGDHMLSAHIKSVCQNIQHVLVGESDTEKGVYSFSYKPKLPSEYTVEVYVNDALLSQIPITLFVVNSPYIPSCSVSGEGANKAVKNKVARFQVRLADIEGSPINCEQTVTVHLRSASQNIECLVLPVQVAICDIPSVYNVSYMPTLSGTCELTILVNNEILIEAQELTVKRGILSPLAGAALHGELDFVKLLLQKGEKLVGSIALHEASRNGHIDTIRYLIEKGADVNAINKDKRTSVFLAAWYGHFDVVNLLVQEGADVKAKDKRSRSALMMAAWFGHESTVESLIKLGADVHDEDELGDSPLHDAARNGHDSIVTTLLKNGANVDTKNLNAQTPLMNAAGNGYSSTAQILIENGASLNIQDNDSRTPLLFAVENQHLHTVVTLIDSGAHINEKNYNGNTVLHIASSCDHNGGLRNSCKKNLITTLLDKGAQIDAQNKVLQTPLLLAVCHGCLGTVHALVKRGADINVKDSASRTAIDCAENLGHREVYEYLQSVYQATV